MLRRPPRSTQSRSSAASDVYKRQMGVLPFLFSSPTNFNVLILAKVIGNTLLAMLSLLVAIATADLLFDLTLSIPHPVLLTLMLLIMVISFIAISVPISYAMLLSRKTGLYMNLLDIPVTLLCGFVFPLSTLPQWTRPLSAVLIPTWTTQLVQQTLQVKIDWSVIKVASIWTIVLLAYTQHWLPCFGASSQHKFVKPVRWRCRNNAKFLQLSVVRL